MLDEWIAHLKKGNCIPEPDLKKLCIMVSKSYLTPGRKSALTSKFNRVSG
jgi:hypothetical protein